MNSSFSNIFIIKYLCVYMYTNIGNDLKHKKNNK